MELAFNVDLGTLFEILLRQFGKGLAEDDDRVPFGLLSPFAAVFVPPKFRGGDAQVGDWPAVLSVADFGIGS